MKKYLVKAHRKSLGDKYYSGEMINIEEVVEAECTADAKAEMLVDNGWDLWIDNVIELKEN